VTRRGNDENVRRVQEDADALTIFGRGPRCIRAPNYYHEMGYRENRNSSNYEAKIDPLVLAPNVKYSIYRSYLKYIPRSIEILKLLGKLEFDILCHTNGVGYKQPAQIKVAEFGNYYLDCDESPRRSTLLSQKLRIYFVTFQGTIIARRPGFPFLSE